MRQSFKLVLLFFVSLVSSGESLAVEISAQQPSFVPETLPIRENNGIPYLCTGIGDSKSDPRIADFPVKIIFATTSRSLYADVTVVVSKADSVPQAIIECDGAWLLLKLAPGSYRIQGTDKKGQVRTCPLVVKSGSPAQCVLTWPE